MFSLLRSSRVAVGRALAAKPAYTPASARAFTAPAWSKGANVGNVTPYTAAATAALVSARARFFATSRASAFAAHAPAAGKTKSAGGAKKSGAKKASAAKKGTKASAAKKKGTKASAAKGGKARTAATERGRGRPKKAKKDVPPKIFKKDLIPPFKSPGSGWTNFVSEFVRAKSDGTPAPVAMAEAASVWKDMTPDVRAKYAPSPEAVAEYKAKKVEWYKALPLTHRRKYRKVRRQPTRGGLATPYGFFTKDNFSRVDGETFGEKTAKVAQMWRDLSESEKEVYRQRSTEHNKALKESQASASASASP